MTTTAPLVSVVMTSYRDPFERLRRAVDSILGQSMPDLELLIAFEPGDPNAEALENAYQDARLIVLRNPTRQGMTRSFNRGLEQARGRYIARMDSDDSAYPKRFEQQLAFFAAHPEVSLTGGAVTIIDDDGKTIATRRFGRDHKAIIRNFALMNALCHPTVMWAREKVGYDLRYDESYAAAEDLELWFRLLGHGHRLANLEEPLIAYKQTAEWRRPMQNWRGNLRVRANHWRLAFRYPVLLVGLCAFAVLAVTPKPIVDRLTGRGGFSDFVRSIRPTPS